MKKEITLNDIADDSNGRLILPLACSAAVLRKEKILRRILAIAVEKKVKGGEVYEALLQTYLFAGFPNALISLQVAADYFPPEHNYKEDVNSFHEKGVVNCKKIYGNKFDKLIRNVNSFSPELSSWLITEGYGKVFSRDGISLKERELCNVSVLASLRYESQLYSHINGAYRLKNSIDDLTLLINSLKITGGVKIQKFGMLVFERFLSQKGMK